jgi:hypothetical protein
MPILVQGLKLGRPLSKLASGTFKTGRRTLRRRLKELGLVEDGAPVYVLETAEDGTTQKRYKNSTPPMTALSDDQLDHLVADILQRFPNFGRTMLHGAIISNGFRISMRRVRDSQRRVKGVSGVFARRRLHRKKYNVPGANSLWHHDGQHGTLFMTPL